MKKLEQIRPVPLLLIASVASAVPFLLVEFFKSELYLVMDTVSYLVFHNVTEFFSVMVSFSIFGLGWYSYDQNRDRHSLFLSVSFLAIGLMDFMHALGYNGMPALITPNDPNKSTQFWVAVRLFSSLSFLASAFIYPDSNRRWLSKIPLMTAALALSCLVFAAVIFYPEQVPAAFVPGIGLTPFKKISEYVIIALLILTCVTYLRRLSRTGERLINYYLAAFVLCIFSEFVFTFYRSVFDTYNALGHIYKVIAFMLIYKGIFVVSVRKPYQDLSQNRNMLSHIINSIPQSLFWKDRNSNYLGCNRVFAKQAGIGSPEEIVGKSDFDLPWGTELSNGYRADDRIVMENAEPRYHIIESLRKADNKVIWIDTTKVPLSDSSGRVNGVLGVYEDITWRKQAEEQLRETLIFNQQIIDSAQEGIVVYDPELRIRVWNPFMERITGVSSAEVLGRTPAELFPFMQENGMVERLARILRGEAVSALEFPFRIDSTGKSGWTSDSSAPLLNAKGEIIGVIGTVRDVTEKRKTEMQLLQAQKMESVGRLAGGVAHDFNNMLTIINCHAALAMMDLDPADPLHEHLDEILSAANRSADITRQLLAFSRQQVTEPRVINLNEAVSGMLKMLRRLIGEDIELIWNPGSELMKVKIDPSQLDQVMANLCVNARDAISGVGRIAIQTENFTLDEIMCDEQSEIQPGEYVMLAVSDNGSGIARDVIKHIFEPFYTTKDVGKGTGLGLATVFGIVKQNGGHIKVYSDPGQGTTFRIYLPGVTGAADSIVREKRVVVGGNETILLVEDELAIMRLGKTMLSKLGYSVLAASSPEEARRLAAENEGRINLLITDIIMPEMNGRDLSELLQQTNPGMKCLFMSGYTADIMSGRGNMDRYVHFLQKPFSMDTLSAKVRRTLEAG
ncbi:MAG: MASE3 domain-containing protein [Geobacteraceae bacterium]|nr:MASE3 domain-containing protein [Geobacteraceae bacterium]